jgi:peptidoglycan/LPS O-acetylase OafA/YrhL
MKYRADIDGLRAVAIIPVVLYHAGIKLFSGGYIGVDVFFVISGYLITSLITDDIEKNRFTLKNFYFRRIKRIFPALYLVLAVTAAAAYFVFLPLDFTGYGKSLTATVYFLSNVLFWRESGYFAEASELKPLLHTWSLAVEEQFYIFYPLALAAVSKFMKKRYAAAVSVIFIFSLVLSSIGVYVKHSAAFYLLPSRAWELMLGALAAFSFMPRLERPALRNLLSVTGLCFVAASIFIYDSSAKFPGLNALLPCIGTFLLIYAGQHEENAVSRILDRKLPVFVGHLSYSWYLWHWVLFAFRNYVDNVTADYFLKSNIFIIIFSLFLAYLSYTFVEKPFKNLKYSSAGKLFAGTAIVMLLLSSAGFLIVRNGGFPERFDRRVVELEKAKNDRINVKDGLRILRDGQGEVTQDATPKIGMQSVSPSFVLWGDSHAQAIAPGIDKIAEEAGRSGLILSYGGCLPVIGIDDGSNFICTGFKNKSFDFIVNSKNVDTVIMSAWWSNSFNRLSVNEYNNTKQSFIDTVNRLEETGKKVLILSDVPSLKYSVPQTLAKSVYFSSAHPSLFKAPSIKITSAEYAEIQKKTGEIFRTVADKTGAQIIDISEPLCRGSYCEIVGEEPYYFDDNHLSIYGSLFITSQMHSEFVTLF